jgi:hypothetical protein
LGTGAGVNSVTSRGQVLGATGKGWSPSITPRGAYQSIAAVQGTAVYSLHVGPHGSSAGQQQK